MSNNGVSIIGPTFTTVNGSAKLPVQISSHDFIENGYPVVTVSLPAMRVTIYRRSLQLVKFRQQHEHASKLHPFNYQQYNSGWAV